MKNFSGINYNYTYRCDFVIVIRIHFNKNLITQKYKQGKNFEQKWKPLLENT